MTLPQGKAPTVEQYTAYSQTFDHFNERLFQGRLEPAMLTIARKGRSRGHFKPRNWRNQQEDKAHEIAIGPDVLAEGFEATMATLLGLMSRQLRWQEASAAGDEKAAATVARGYHDARLVDIMQDVGLMPVGKDGEPALGGWNLDVTVVPEAEADDAIDRLPRRAHLPWKAVAEAQGEGVQQKKKTGRVKFTCARCASHVLGRPGLHVYCTGGDGDEHVRVRMIGEDDTDDAPATARACGPDDADEVLVATAEGEADTRVKEAVEQRGRRPASRPIGEQLPRREPHDTNVVVPGPGGLAPAPNERAAETYRERLDEWAEDLKKDRSLAWADLTRIEARLGAVHRVIADHRRRWVGRELEVGAGEALSLCDERDRWLTVPEGTRVLVRSVSKSLGRDDRIKCLIRGGNGDGRRVTIPAERLREVPLEGVPVRDDHEQPFTPVVTSAVLGYVTGEVHLVRGEGGITERLCDGGAVDDWDYGRVGEVTCALCLERRTASQT